MAGMMLFFASCGKDCVCRYYNQNNTVIDTEIYDADDVTTSDCADRDGEENVLTDDNTLADHVSCSAGW